MEGEYRVTQSSEVHKVASCGDNMDLRRNLTVHLFSSDEEVKNKRDVYNLSIIPEEESSHSIIIAVPGSGDIDRTQLSQELIIPRR